MKSGDRVRLRSDPGRLGVLLEGERVLGGMVLRTVAFPDGKQRIPEDQLEVLPDSGDDDPLERFEEGRLSTAADVRRALVNARLTGKLANILYSLDTTNTDFYAYQFKPVVKLIESPTTGILVADEVGLGKTIEAGLIWTELRSRQDASRLLVICPAFLRQKWHEELLHRFGVEAESVNAEELLDRLQRPANAGSGFACICSMQGLRPSKGWRNDDPKFDGAAEKVARLLNNNAHEEPLIDLLVVDEAHYLRNAETSTADLGRLLRDVSAHVVLLSATPVHLHSQDLYQLMNLVDEDAFNTPPLFEQQLEANAPLLEAREMLLRGRCKRGELKSRVAEAAEHPVLEGNQQLQQILKEIDQSDLTDKSVASRLAAMLDSANLLGFALTRTRKRDVHEWRVIRDPVDEGVTMTSAEESFYEKVTEVVREYADNRKGVEGFLLVLPQRQMSSSMPAALRAWQERAEIDAEGLSNDLELELGSAPIGPLVRPLISRVSEFGDYRQLREDDSKYRRLRDILPRFLAVNPSEKVVLFAYFRPTLQYLRERLEEDGISAIVLQGGEDKDAVLEAFKKPSGPRVLLSSEVGSEGIDLQFSHVLINYDLPWNPMRLEQRIGRLDRIGQRSSKIHIWNLFYEDTIDARIYLRLSKRLAIAQRSLGALEAVLARDIQRLTIELLTRALTREEQDARIEQTSQALANRQLQEEELEEQAAHLVQYGDYIVQQIYAARELGRRITEDDLQEFVLGHLRMHYPGCSIRRVDEARPLYEIALSVEAKNDLAEFMRLQRASTTTGLTRNDPRPIRCSFTAKITHSFDSGAEPIHQVHPLVRMIGQRNRTSSAHQPAVAIAMPLNKAPEGIRPGSYAFVVRLWSVSGIREVEQLHFSVFRIEPSGVPVAIDDDAGEVFVMSAARTGTDDAESMFSDAVRIALDAALLHTDAAYNQFVEDIRRANEDRAKAQERTLDIHEESQRRKYADLAQRHRAAGRESLARAEEGQIRKAEERVRRQRLKIAEQRKTASRWLDVSLGTIRVTT